MLATLTCTLALMASPVQDGAKNWEFRAARWESLAPVLAKEMGVPVRVSEKIRDEIVMGRFVDKTSKEMVEAFSKATLTSWVDDRGTILILPDGGARSEEAKRVRQEKIATFHKNLARQLSQPYTQAALDKAIGEAYKLSEQMMSEQSNYDYRTVLQMEAMAPGNRLAYEFLQTLGAEAVIDADESQRIVYTLNPTRYQRSLGRLGQTIMTQAKAYREMRRLALQNYGASDYQGGYFHSLLNDYNQDEEIADVKVSLRVQYGHAQVQIEGMDATGNTVFSGHGSVNTTNDEAQMGVEVGSGEEEPSIPENPFKDFDQMVKVHPNEANLRAIFNPFGGVKATEEDKKKAWEMMAEILDEEPLSWTTSNVMFALSEASGKDVAGRVTDALLALGSMEVSSDGRAVPSEGANREVKLSTYLMPLAMFGGRIVVETEDGYRIQPSVSLGFNTILDRRMTSVLAKEKLKTGTISFDTWADVAAGVESRQSFEMMNQLVQSLTLGSQGAMSHSYGGGVMADQYETLRVYGSLPRHVRAQARMGTVRVSAGDLSATGQQTLINVLTLNQGTFGVRGQADTVDGSMSPEASELQTALWEKYGMKMNEPTFVLATPEASPLVLEVSIGTRNQMMAQSSYQYNPYRTGSVRTLAEQAALAQKALESGSSEDYYQPFTGFAMYESDLLTIRVLGGQSFETRMECETMNRPLPKFGGIESLPEALRAEYENEFARALEMYKNVDFGDGQGSRTIPPVP